MLRFCFKLDFNLNAGAGNGVTKCSLSEGCIFRFCTSAKRKVEDWSGTKQREVPPLLVRYIG